MARDYPENTRLNVSIQAGLLEDIVTPAVEVAKEGLTNFRWEEDGLFVSSIDPANAIMICQEIQEGEFERYDVEPAEDEVVFGTPCKTISRLLRAADSDEIVQLELNVDSNRMEIQFADVDYSMAGIAPGEIDEGRMPELEYDIEAVVHSSVLLRACQVVGMISDSIRFSISKDRFSISGEGDTDIAEIDVELREEEDEIVHGDNNHAATILEVSESAEARYGTQFVQHLNAFTPSTSLIARFGEDYPLQVKTERSSGRIQSEITIAPRMRSD